MQALILQHVHHPNIVTYLGSWISASELTIAMEYCSSGDLFNFLAKRRVVLPVAHAGARRQPPNGADGAGPAHSDSGGAVGGACSSGASAGGGGGGGGGAGYGYLPEAEILGMFAQCCLAIGYLHSQRILHRDLKSKNVFLAGAVDAHGPSGHAGVQLVKIGDFGIAKVRRVVGKVE
jgi:serine/threonine protein kinase